MDVNLDWLSKLQDSEVVARPSVGPERALEALKAAGRFSEAAGPNPLMWWYHKSSSLRAIIQMSDYSVSIIFNDDWTIAGRLSNQKLVVFMSKSMIFSKSLALWASFPLTLISTTHEATIERQPDLSWRPLKHFIYFYGDGDDLVGGITLDIISGYMKNG